jgi:hypothetical protein
MRKAASFALLTLLVLAQTADAARVRVTRTGPRGRTRVTVRTVRPAPVVRITPRVHLAPVVFTAAVVSTIPNNQVWHDSEEITRREGWTEFVMNVDRRGDRMFLEIDRGAAQISYAEVVFENGEAQFVDFNDKQYGKGVYSLLDFRDGRKVDHVRVVAQAESRETQITVRLTS